MNITARPAALWETLATDEVENLTVDLAVGGGARHVVIIPRAVLTAAVGLSGSVLEVGRSHHAEIETAIGRAWHPERLEELIGVNHPGHIFQLWLDASDFA